MEIVTLNFNGSKYDEQYDFWSSLPFLPEILISVFGYFGNQELAMNDFNEAKKQIN